MSLKKKILAALSVGVFAVGMAAPVMNFTPDAAQSYAAAAKPQSSGVPKLDKDTTTMKRGKNDAGYKIWSNVTTNKTRTLKVHGSSAKINGAWSYFPRITITNRGNYDIQLEIPNPNAKNFDGSGRTSNGTSGPKWTPMKAQTITVKPGAGQSFDLAPDKDGVINIKQVGGKVSHAEIKIIYLFAGSQNGNSKGTATLTPMN